MRFCRVIFLSSFWFGYHVHYVYYFWIFLYILFVYLIKYFICVHFIYYSILVYVAILLYFYVQRVRVPLFPGIAHVQSCGNMDVLSLLSDVASLVCPLVSNSHHTSTASLTSPPHETFITSGLKRKMVCVTVFAFIV